MSYIAQGKPVILGQRMGDPGHEGTVYAIQKRPELVAKVLHHDKRTPERISKLRAMVARKPAPRTAKDKVTGAEVPTIAWPEEMLFENGLVVGFVMRALDRTRTVEIVKIENPSMRSNIGWGIPLGLGIRSYIAMNLAFAASRVHAVDAVIGDFNQRNVMVSKSLIVSIIDCDSMQIRDIEGRFHFCDVFTPGFLAPELHQYLGRLDRQVRTIHSDLFTLAVHIYCLFLDRHPFQNGIYRGPGENPMGDALAKSGQWRGRPGGYLLPEKGQQDPAMLLPPNLMTLFRRAFEVGVTNPQSRPSAAEWQDEIRTFLGDWKPAR